MGSDSETDTGEGQCRCLLVYGSVIAAGISLAIIIPGIVLLALWGNGLYSGTCDPYEKLKNHTVYQRQVIFACDH